MIKLGLKLLLMVMLVPTVLLLAGCPLSGATNVKIRNYDDAYLYYQALTKSAADTTSTLLQVGALTKAQGQVIHDRLVKIQDQVETTKQFKNLSDLNTQIQLLTTLTAELNAKKLDAEKKERSSRLELIPALG